MTTTDARIQRSVQACRTCHRASSRPRYHQPAIGSASASGFAPDRCWAVCITNMCWCPRWRDRVIAEHRQIAEFGQKRPLRMARAPESASSLQLGRESTTFRTSKMDRAGQRRTGSRRPGWSKTWSASTKTGSKTSYRTDFGRCVPVADIGRCVRLDTLHRAARAACRRQ
jgi:hypothetical protein